ncbi:hypothetical protein BH20PSE1_BH20PSE1_23840 [soil metagenome]
MVLVDTNVLVDVLEDELAKVQEENQEENRLLLNPVFLL